MGLVWIIIGLVAQFMFSIRFILQWIASERARASKVPKAFWYFSCFGGALLFIYAIHRSDPVFVIGQAAGLIVYLRNLYFIRLGKRTSNAPNIA
jgi:lipid-A-disaccharide synthase-like uncharacterized protein